MNINGFEVEKFNIYNIPENAKYHICPECSHTRNKSTDKCMSVFWDTGLGRCNHCGAQVQLHIYKKKNESSIRQYVKPANVNTTNLDDRHVEWFESRGISQSTLRRAGISSGATYMPDGKGGYQKRMAIMFNYIKDGELTNIKYRDGDKNFKLVKDAERIFYNIDGIRTSKECIIAEGEIDALTYMEIGRWDVVSLPNGASLKTVNLEYLDSAISYFENKDIIYLALDTDEAGLNTQKELLRRLGADKCRIVDMRGYKDPNDILIAEGIRGVSLSIENAREVPIENVSSVGDWEDEYDYFLLNGMKQGYGIGKPYFDDVFTTYTGQFITVTGIPSCLTGETLVTMANGSQRRIDSLNKGDKIISIDENLMAVEDTVEEKWQSGVKEVYRLKLKSGKEIKATKEHVFRTINGLRELGSINIGDYIGTLKNKEFSGSDITEDEAILLAIWLADGNKAHNSFYFTKKSQEMISKVEKIVERNSLRMSAGKRNDYILSEITPLEMERSRYISAISYSLRQSKGLNMEDSKRLALEMYNKRKSEKASTFSPMDMLKKYGVDEMTTNTIGIPDCIFTADNKIVSVFLSYLFSCDGSAYGSSVEYYSNSKQVCADISILLARFNITSILSPKKVTYKGETHLAYRLTVGGRDNVVSFCEAIGMDGDSERLEKVYHSVLKKKGRNSGALSKYKTRPEHYYSFKGNLEWEEVVSIDNIGFEMTYDIEVKVNENFIANAINVKNCGKSDFVDEMVIGYNRLHGWKVAYASPENKPNVIHASKIEAKLVGQWVRSEEQLRTNWHQRAKEHIHDNFKFIDLERYTLENVLSKAKEMIRRFGIKVLVIDPYNKIPLEGDKDSMSVSYTSEYLLKVDEFARNNDILIILVAHPRKPSFSDGKYIPTMYDIKGSGEFYDMSPHGLVVHRDFENEASMVKVLKCKFSFLGETGAQTWFKWNKNNGRFSEFGVHGSEIEECSYVEYNNTNEFADDDEVEPIVQQQSEDLPW